MPLIDEILLLHHSHFDGGFTHTQPVIWELQREFIGDAIQWLETFPDGRWTCEATEPVLRWLEHADQEEIGRFSNLVRTGRMGLAGMRWHTTPLADQDGLRRLLNGKRLLERRLGTTIRVACQHDVTGIPWPLGDILLDAGVDLLVMAINPHLGRAVQPRPGLFWWETPSGRRIRVFNGNHYTMFDQLLLAWHDSVDAMHEGWTAYAEHLDRIGYPLDFVYLTTTCSPICWDNSPPNPFMPELIRRWNADGRGPRIRYATFDDLRERILRIPGERLPVMRGDWTDYWNLGCGSSPRSTARNQQAKALLRAATVIAGGSLHRIATEAADEIDLYEEHTFGSCFPDPWHPQQQALEAIKQASAYRGGECAAFALMDALERLAGNPLADRGIERILLVNPGPLPQAIRPVIPLSWLNGTTPETNRTYRTSRMTFEARSWESSLGVEGTGCAPVTLPPRSWRILPLEGLRQEGDSALRHRIVDAAFARREVNTRDLVRVRRQIGHLESPTHILRYDADTGRILGLEDRRLGCELLSVRDGLDLFAFVRERPDKLVEGRRYAFYQRDLDREKVDGSCWIEWMPIHERARHVCRIGVRQVPGAIILERELEADGVRHLVQRFVLQADSPVITIEVDLELEADPSPHAIYFAIPLAMREGWSACFDTAGTTVRVDDDQLPGACRNWVTCESYAVISAGTVGVSLLVPDAPLIQFGGFHFGPPLDRLPRPQDPLLLSWPVNNYWDVNYPLVQSAAIRLRYGVLSFDPADILSLPDIATQFRLPGMSWPVTTHGRPAGEGSLT